MSLHEDHDVVDMEPGPGERARRLCRTCGTIDVWMLGCVEKIDVSISYGAERGEFDSGAQATTADRSPQHLVRGSEPRK